MNWKTFWNEQSKHENDALKVGRAVKGEVLSPEQLETIAKYIASTLSLNSNDTLLDLCCGNGMLTKLLAPYCKEITGIDLSQKLITEAKSKFIHPKITYLEGDVANMTELVKGKKFNKILLYFSFQYIEKTQTADQIFKQFYETITPNGLILIGDIPDAEKLHIFYPNLIDRIKYFIRSWKGTETMGRFWHTNELDKIASNHNLIGKAISEPAYLPYSHYRFDYLILPKQEI